MRDKTEISSDDIQKKENPVNMDSGTDTDDIYSREGIITPGDHSGSADPTDGRKKYDWKTRYPKRARIEIGIESVFLFFLLTIALFFIFCAWSNLSCAFLSLPDDKIQNFVKYTYYTMSGLLGGVLFDLKSFYKSIARGWWHLDRRIWRFASPFVAMVVGFVVGAMVECSMITTSNPISAPGIISIGFLSGYFADSAIGKMREVAGVLFGKSMVPSDDGK